MKFFPVNRIQREHIFLLKNSAENDAEKLDPDVFLFSKKSLNKVKASCQQFSFNIFS